MQSQAKYIEIKKKKETVVCKKRAFNSSPSFEGVVTEINIPRNNQVSSTIKVVPISVCRAWPETYWAGGLQGTVTYILKSYTCIYLYLQQFIFIMQTRPSSTSFLPSSVCYNKHVWTDEKIDITAVTYTQLVICYRQLKTRWNCTYLSLTIKLIFFHQIITESYLLLLLSFS